MQPLTLPTPLLAEIQSGVMARSLVIALVVVAPFWFLMRQRLRARRPAQEPEPTAETAPAGPTLESLVEDITRLAAAADGSTTVTVPAGLTIDGKAAPAAVVDAIVRDAIRRSGLVPTAELDRGDVRVIECRPRLDTTRPSR